MKLKTHKKMEKKLLTVNGELTYSRYVLRPADEESRELLKKKGLNTVVPLDCALHINKSPFKMTVSVMLKTAYYATVLDSYQIAADFLKRTYRIEVSDDTVRSVVYYIGKMVYEEDCRVARKCLRNRKNRKEDFPKKEGILYLVMKNAELKTQVGKEDEYMYRKYMLGMAFSTDDIYSWVNEEGKQCRKLKRKEYISYIGSVTGFKEHLFVLAVRNGVEQYKKTVIFTDGTEWIKRIQEEFFPEAQLILDYYSLYKKVRSLMMILCGPNKEKCKRQTENICKKLKKGKYEEVIKKLEKVKIGFREIEDFKKFINDNKCNMNYSQYKENGYFIKSGDAESGKATVMGFKLRQSERRWSPEKAQYLMSLQAKEKSNLWDSWVVPLVAGKLG